MSYGHTVQGLTPGGSDFRCFWIMGVWGLYVEWEVVQLRLPEGWDGVHTTVKELLPIVLGVAIWGSEWKGLTVVCFCDNAAVVAIVNSGRSKMDRAMHLMRCLSFFLARWWVTLVCRHIPGAQNGAADALSRDDLPSFQRLVPQADSAPTVLPPQPGTFAHHPTIVGARSRLSGKVRQVTRTI